MGAEQQQMTAWWSGGVPCIAASKAHDVEWRWSASSRMACCATHLHTAPARDGPPGPLSPGVTGPPTERLNHRSRYGQCSEGL